MKIAMSILIVASALLADWPIQYGAGNSLQSPSTVLKPPLKLKWAAPLHDQFKRGPVVAENKVVIQGTRGYLYCLDAETGNPLWRTFVNTIDYAASPGIWNGKVYATFYSEWLNIRGLYCFDLETGDSLWKQDVGKVSAASPLFGNGKVVILSDRDTTEGTYGSSGRHFKAQLRAWDASTGAILWTISLWDTACSQRKTIIASGDTIFVSINYGTGGKTFAFDFNGKELWTSTAHHVPSDQGYIQTFGPYLIIQEGDDKTALINRSDWSVYKENLRGKVFRPFIWFNDYYWVRNYGNVLEKHSTSSGNIISYHRESNVKSGCNAPVAANGYIYNSYGHPAQGYENLPHDSGIGHTVVAWDQATGNKVWSFRTGSNNCGSMAIAGNRLYVVSVIESFLYCFENE